MPGWEGLFLTFHYPTDEIPQDEADLLKATPAIRLGTMPVRPEALLNAEGLIDFGPVAFTLPKGAGLVLRQGSGFPLGLQFGETAYAGFRVNTEIIGWPDANSLPTAARVPDASDYKAARSQVARWEADYRARDLGGVMGSGYKLTRYEATPLELPGGPCIRIREDIGVVQSDEGWRVSPSLTAYLRQACITPTGGAFLVVTAAVNEPANDDAVAAFEASSRAILDSLRLGFAPAE